MRDDADLGEEAREGVVGDGDGVVGLELLLVLVLELELEEPREADEPEHADEPGQHKSDSTSLQRECSARARSEKKAPTLRDRSEG